jgi:hypothetical protein
LEIPAVTDDCGAGKDTRFNDRKQCLGSAISNRCKTVLSDSCSTLTKTHAVARSLLQLHFQVLKQLSSISTTLPSLPQPTTNPKKKLYGKTQMKTDIALQQNCDQSVKIWRSTQSST